MPYKLSSLLTFKNVRLVVCVLLCVIGFVSFGQSQIDSLQTQNALNAYQTQYASLQEEYNKVATTAVKSEDKVQSEIHSASVAGNKIAELQSAYSGMNPDSGNFESTYLEIDSYLSQQDKNERVPWYGGVSFDYVWTFCSTYDFEGSSLPCIWLCYQQSGGEAVGPVLAYATASYSPSANGFSNVSHNMTYEGASLNETT